MNNRKAFVGSALAIGLLALTALIIRADVVHRVHGLMLVGHLVLGVGFLIAAGLIIRDLRRRTHSARSVYSIAMVLTWVAGALTVVALVLGLRAPSDPKSIFDAFYVFVFYFACAIWGLESRVANAELSAREQSLRIECRLADMAQRINK
jgi:hypothetical protein